MATMNEQHVQALDGPQKRRTSVRIGSIGENCSGQKADLEKDEITIVRAIDRGFTKAERIFDATQMNLNLQLNLKDTLNWPETSNYRKTLPELIREATTTNKPRWLPQDQLFLLINKASVYDELVRTLTVSGDGSTRQPLEFLRKTADEVCKSVPLADQKLRSSRRGIFATLCLLEQQSMNLLEETRAFLDAELTDADLPLAPDHQWKENTAYVDLYGHSDESGRIRISRPWAENAVILFDQYQNRVTAPFFDLPVSIHDKVEVPFYELADNVVLPFIEDGWDESGTRSGFHGSVRKVLLHPAHHCSNEGQINPYFAVKELNPSEQQDIASQHEIINWIEAVGASGDPHLVKLLAVWRQKNCFSLMFPWAYGGNLRELWASQKITPLQDDTHVEWVLKQLIGITKALRRIHRKGTSFDKLKVQKFGIHGDIKPENILWYSGMNQNDLGYLAICDFGFTRFHNIASRSAAHAPGMTSTYRAPEFDQGDPDCKISRASDMWSLGCVFLEFVTWYLLGGKPVEYLTGLFAAMRADEEKRNGANGIGSNVNGHLNVPEDKFFRVATNSSGPTVIVKDCVRQWTRELYTTEGCSSLIRELLDLITEKLLVIAVDGEGCRGGSDFVERSLSEMMNNCKKYGESYSLHTAPTTVLRHKSLYAEEAAVVDRDPASQCIVPGYNMPWQSYNSGKDSQARGIDHILAEGVDMDNKEHSSENRSAFSEGSWRYPYASQRQPSPSPVRGAPRLLFSEYCPEKKLRRSLDRGDYHER